MAKTIRTLLDPGPQTAAAAAIRQALAQKLGVPKLSESDTVKHGLAALGDTLGIAFPLVASPPK